MIRRPAASPVPRRTPLLAGALLLALVLVPGCDDGGPSSPALPDHADEWLHVATDGSGINDGSADRPLYHPYSALKTARDEGYRGVRIAAGDYTEVPSGDEMRFFGGVDVVGGCDRTTWEPVPGATSRLDPGNRSALALGIRVPTRISGLDLGIGTLGPGQYAAPALHVEGCGPELVFADCRFEGPVWDPWTNPADDGRLYPNGPDAMSGANGGCDGTPGAGAPLSPGDICSSRGGDGGGPGLPGKAGSNSCVFPEDLLSGDGGAPGQPGADGLDGEHGEDGAPGEPTTTLGRLTIGAISPLEGERGDSGRSGDDGGGGGGGGGSLLPDGGGGGGGGGGGNGGSGGGGGSGGADGGHSIGVIATASDARFENCRFVARDGADGQGGGNGAAGEAGPPGAAGGTGCGDAGDGGRGGNGGDGGNGGGGAGGQGGHSYGLLVLGNISPTTTACTFSAGTAGRGGPGGLSGDGVTAAPAGLDGRAVARFHLTVDAKGLIRHAR